MASDSGWDNVRAGDCSDMAQPTLAHDLGAEPDFDDEVRQDDGELWADEEGDIFGGDCFSSYELLRSIQAHMPYP